MRWAFALLGLLATAAHADDEGTALLPEVSLHLKAARYAPSEADFQWDGWIGAGAGIVRAKRTTLYFTADVETVIGSVKRAFDANQANYHLETGFRSRVGRGDATLFFNHVSRHAVDRPKVQAVDWNVLGVRASAPLPARFPFHGRATLGVGHTTLVSLVGYEWELTLHMDAEVLRRPKGAAYVAADARAFTTKTSPEFPRDGFLDASIEGGARFERAGRTLDVFLAYEHRNDVYLERPGFRDRALFGFRIAYPTPSSSSPR